MSEQESKREKMRRDFPDTADMIDQLRTAFGDDTKVLWCSENGKTVGKQTWSET